MAFPVPSEMKIHFWRLPCHIKLILNKCHAFLCFCNGVQLWT
jgi:hypothetical protein